MSEAVKNEKNGPGEETGRNWTRMKRTQSNAIGIGFRSREIGLDMHELSYSKTTNIGAQGTTQDDYLAVQSFVAPPLPLDLNFVKEQQQQTADAW